jgi:hypothetical protein
MSCAAAVKYLGIGIYGDILDTIETSLNHAFNSVASATSNTDYFKYS